MLKKNKETVQMSKDTIIRSIVCIILAVFAAFQVWADSPTPTLDVDFREALHVKLGSSEYKINGDGIEQLKDGSKALLYGRKNAFTVPLQGLIGAEGTIVWKFAYKDFTTFKDTPRRPMLTLGTSGRFKASFSTAVNVRPPTLQYSFSDGKNAFYHIENKLEFGRIYTAAMTFDGTKVRCYLDGVLVKENPQPVAIDPASWRNIYVGPFNDGWTNFKGWDGDTYAYGLKLFNRALTPSEVAVICGLKAKEISERIPQILTVPCSAQKLDIKCDGEIGEKAWLNAAGTIGSIDSDSPKDSWRMPPNSLKLTSDKENLYLAFTAIFPANTNIKYGPTAQEGEKEVWGSESFEVNFVNGKDNYRFAASAGGGRTESKNRDSEYNAPWQYAGTLKMRIDDTVLWQGEIAIPWGSIGCNDEASKSHLTFNFCHTWLLGDRRILSTLARPGQGYDDFGHYTRLQLSENAPVLSVISQNDPTYGTFQQKATFFNNGESDAIYSIALDNSKGLIAPETIFQTKVPPKSRRDIDVNAVLSNENADYLVFKAGGAGGERIFQQQCIPVRISPDYLTVIPLFGQGKIKVLYKKAQAQAAKGASFQGIVALRDQSGKTLQSKPATECCEFAFPRDSQVGFYKVELCNATGKETLTGSTFHFPGFGAWSRPFDDNRIVPPFTPIVAKGTANAMSVSVWGREYQLSSGEMFLRNIVSQKEKLLCCAPELCVNGRNVANSARSAWGTSVPHRFEYNSHLETSQCQADSSSWIEYDGVSYNTVSFASKQRLDSVELVFTLPDDIAKYLHAAAVPWGTKITDTVNPGLRTFRFYPVVMLANEERGFCFFAESRHDWPEKASNNMALEKRNGKVTLTVKLAGKMEPGQKFTFCFGLLGTPVKPLPKNYPLNTMGGYPELNRPGRTPTTYASFAYWPSFQTHGDCMANLPPENNPLLAHYRKESERFSKLNCKVFPYAMAMALPDEYPEVADFLKEWAFSSESPYPYEKNGQKYGVWRLCPTTQALDFFVWNARQLFQNVKLDGIYFDYGSVHECNNNEHGCHDLTPILAFREFLRRIAIVMLEAGVKDYHIVLHNTDVVQMPAFTFATHLFNGEDIRQSSSSILHNGKDILDTYPLSRFAVELNSLNLGITNSSYMPSDVLSPKYGGGKEDPQLYTLRMARAMMAGTLVHNSIPAMNRMHHGIFDKVIRIYSAFDVPNAAFYGYYDKQCPIKVLEGENVYVSCYKHATDNKMLAVVSHLGNKRIDQTVKLQVLPSSVGLKSMTAAVEKMEETDPEYELLEPLRVKGKVPPYRVPLKWAHSGNKVISFSDDILTLELKAHSFAIVELR